MQKFFKDILLYLIIIIITASVTIYFCKKRISCYGDHSCSHCIENKYFCEITNPNAEQKQKITEYDNEYNKFKSSYDLRLNSIRVELAELLMVERIDSVKITGKTDELNKLHNEMNTEIINHIIRITEVLDKEQRKNFLRFIINELK